MAGTDAAGLALGPQARSQRSALRRQLAEGKVDLAGLVAGDGDPTLEQVALPMQVGDLLKAAPRCNVLAVAANGNLTSLEVALRDLPMAQRRRLADAIRRDRA